MGRFAPVTSQKMASICGVATEARQIKDWWAAAEGALTIKGTDRTSETVLVVVCSAVVCVTLALGLWPFHAPENEVTWLGGTNGVAFGKYGTILGTGPVGAGRSGTGSIEIWVQPDRPKNATFLSLYNPRDRTLFRLEQASSDLVVETRASRNQQFEIKNAFGFALRQNKPVFVTIISGQHRSAVFLDGRFAASAPESTIPPDALGARLIVGDSPRQNDSFRGKILGVAIYDKELTAVETLRHYQSWTKNARPDAGADECNVALYLFNERAGRLIHNFADQGSGLLIPRTYTVVDKFAFEPFSEEFEMSIKYWRGNLKNIVGFLPVGFCFYAYFLVVRPIQRAVLVTVMVGMLISVTIEVAQTFLPTRDSGTTDIITNTFGTWLGIAVYRRAYPLILAGFAQVAGLLTRRS